MKPVNTSSPVKDSQKIGIFGGTFDPLHLGHINSMKTVKDSMELSRVVVVPAFQSPFRQPLQGPEPQQRLEMVERALSEDQEEFYVDQREVKRGGISWTIDTITSLVKENPGKEYYLIIGMDQFEGFDRWKDFEKILEKVHLVVTSRPGMELPETAKEFAPGVRALVEDFDGSTALLNNGKNIFFVQLEDIDVSGTEIRRRIRSGQSVSDLVPKAIEDYIQEHNFYGPFDSKIGDFEAFTRFCAGILNDKGGINVQGYDLRQLEAPSEFTLITSGTSTKHASSLAESVAKSVKQEYGVFPQSIEGAKEGRWIVIDYGSLLVHVFYDYVRQEYRLEELWRSGERMKLEGLSKTSTPS